MPIGGGLAPPSDGKLLVEVIDNAPTGIANVAIDGHWLRVNRALCEIVGYSEAQLRGRRFQDFTHPDDVAVSDAQIGLLLAGQLQAARFQKRYLHRDGHIVWVKISVSVLRDEQGTPVSFVSQLEDITAARHVEQRLRERERQLAEAQALANLGSWELDAIDGRARWSPEMFRIFGREEEFAPTWDEYLALCHPDDRAAVAGRVAGTQPGGSAENEYRIVRPDGEVRTVHGRSDRRVGEDGMPARLFGTIQDITDRKRAELELARERDHTAAIVSAMSEGYMLAVDERIAVVNDALCALTGFRRAELVGAGHPYPFAPRGVSGQALAVRESTVAAGGGTAQLTLMRRDGTRVEAEITSRAARNPDGSVLGFVTTVRDISAQKRHEAELTRLADHDPLTGLANHRAFHERLDAEITRARRRDRPLGVCIFDLDHFKHVNDHHGHLAGDQVLHAVAERLAALVADGQLLARVGGEEFAWILPGVEGVELFAAAERTRQAIAAAPIEPVGELTLSAGVCDLAHAGESSELYPRADEALYWAKAHGRNRTFRYSTDTADEMLASEARLADQRRTLLAHLSELARSADQRHPHFADHATAVASLSVVLATHAGWSPEDIESLRVAALLHDLGKVAVPESIIAKAGSLTETERAQLRTHAAIGAEMVAAALTPAQVSWIRHHHEHWDGAGYPDRLARSAIPEGAQLIALADAFDAMTSARPYREALTMEMAILEIHAGAGTQCAPHAVALFDAALPAVRSSRGG